MDAYCERVGMGLFAELLNAVSNISFLLAAWAALVLAKRVGAPLNMIALSATAHCLTGCAIGEVLGVATGTALRWGDFTAIALAVALAFFFGYLLPMLPLLRSGLALRRCCR